MRRGLARYAELAAVVSFSLLPRRKNGYYRNIRSKIDLIPEGCRYHRGDFNGVRFIGREVRWSPHAPVNECAWGESDLLAARVVHTPVRGRGSWRHLFCLFFLSNGYTTGYYNCLMLAKCTFSCQKWIWRRLGWWKCSYPLILITSP